VNVALAPQRSLNVDAIEVSARIEDLFASPRGGMRVYAEGAKTSDARFASVVFEVKMEDLRRSSARLQTRGELHEPFELEALADYRPGSSMRVTRRRCRSRHSPLPTDA
jgi:hypothetical protein